MKRETYIVTKIIDAEPMNLGDYNSYRGWQIPPEEDPKAEGFLVIYPDGCQSWSPKHAFDEAYRRTDGLNFGLALEAMWKGYKVARTGWNGKNMYIRITGSSRIIPEDARNGVAYSIAKEGAPHIDINAHIDMKAADGSVVVGWLASQTDMLTDDWQILD
jgi:hypothetical protein